MADHRPLSELREAPKRVLVSLKSLPTRIRVALTESPARARNRAVAAGCAAAAALLIGGGAWAAASAPAPMPVPADPPTAAALPSEDGGSQGTEPVAVALKVTAEGYTDQSSPLVAVVTGTEAAPAGAGSEGADAAETQEQGAKVDFAHAVTPAEVQAGSAAVELKPGTYTVSFVSPVNGDGSIYKVPAPVEVTVPAPEEEAEGESKAEPETPRVEVKLDPVPADQVTKEQLDEIKSDLADAVAKGDSTLSGDKGSSATDTADKNAGQAPVSKGEEPKPAEEPKAEEQKPAEGGGSGAQPGGASQPSGNSQGSSGSQSSGGGGSSSQSSGGGSQSSGGGAPQQPARKWVPEQGHNEPVYENVWVPNVQYIRHPKFVCNGCGAAFGSVDAWGDHDFAYCEKGDFSHGTYLDDSYTETVDNGHYEKKQTGQKWVVDVPGHWE